jgi:hypothetical protein
MLEIWIDWELPNYLREEILLSSPFGKGGKRGIWWGYFFE